MSAEQWSPEAEAAITAELVACTLGQRRRWELNVEIGARMQRLGEQWQAFASAIGTQLVPPMREAAAVLAKAFKASP